MSLKSFHRQPNLSTIRMVEDFLKSRRGSPMKFSVIRKGLPKQVMHQTLQTIMEYLWESGKITYGSKGIQWTYVSPEIMNELLEDSVEI